MTEWDFQNKGKLSWTCKSSFVLKVPLRHLRPSVIYSVPCDRILQRVNSGIKTYLWSFPLQVYRWPRLGEEAAEIWREISVFI